MSKTDSRYISTTLESKRIFYGWIIVAVTWLVYMFIISMPLYGGSVLNSLLVLETDVTEKDLSFATTIYTVMSGILAPLVGRLIKRRGAKITFLLGLGFAFLGAVCNIVLPASRGQLILCHGILVAIGIGVGGSLSTQSLIIKWFDKNRTTALAITLTSGAVGGFIAPILMNAIAAGSGRKMGWLFIAVGTVIMFILTVVAIKDTPEEIGEVPDGRAYACRAAEKTNSLAKNTSHQADNIGCSLSFKEALKEKELYIFAMMNSVRMALYYSFTGYAVVYAVQCGIENGYATLLISIVSVSSLVGRLACGAIGKTGLSPKVLMFISCLCMAGCGCFLSVGGSFVFFALGSLCCGTGFGIAMIASTIYLTHYFGADYYPVISGSILPVSNIMAAVGPAAAGAAVAVTGSYSIPFLVMGLANAAVAVICLSSKMPRKRRNIS